MAQTCAFEDDYRRCDGRLAILVLLSGLSIDVIMFRWLEERAARLFLDEAGDALPGYK